MKSRGTTFDKPPSFESFLNNSLLLSPQKIVRPSPITEQTVPKVQYPNHTSWAKVLANAHFELNKFGSTFEEYTQFSLSQQDCWADDLVEENIL